eukprot:s919_g1.t2
MGAPWTRSGARLAFFNGFCAACFYPCSGRPGTPWCLAPRKSGCMHLPVARGRELSHFAFGRSGSLIHEFACLPSEESEGLGPSKAMDAAQILVETLGSAPAGTTTREKVLRGLLNRYLLEDAFRLGMVDTRQMIGLMALPGVVVPGRVATQVPAAEASGDEAGEASGEEDSDDYGQPRGRHLGQEILMGMRACGFLNEEELHSFAANMEIDLPGPDETTDADDEAPPKLRRAGRRRRKKRRRLGDDGAEGQEAAEDDGLGVDQEAPPAVDPPRPKRKKRRRRKLPPPDVPVETAEGEAADLADEDNSKPELGNADEIPTQDNPKSEIANANEMPMQEASKPELANAGEVPVQEEISKPLPANARETPAEDNSKPSALNESQTPAEDYWTPKSLNDTEMLMREEEAPSWEKLRPDPVSDEAMPSQEKPEPEESEATQAPAEETLEKVFGKRRRRLRRCAMPPEPEDKSQPEQSASKLQPAEEAIGKDVPDTELTEGQPTAEVTQEDNHSDDHSEVADLQTKVEAESDEAASSSVPWRLSPCSSQRSSSSDSSSSSSSSPASSPEAESVTSRKAKRPKAKVKPKTKPGGPPGPASKKPPAKKVAEQAAERKAAPKAGRKPESAAEPADKATEEKAAPKARRKPKSAAALADEAANNGESTLDCCYQCLERAGATRCPACGGNTCKQCQQDLGDDDEPARFCRWCGLQAGEAAAERMDAVQLMYDHMNDAEGWEDQVDIARFRNLLRLQKQSLRYHLAKKYQMPADERQGMKKRDMLTAVIEKEHGIRPGTYLSQDAQTRPEPTRSVDASTSVDVKDHSDALNLDPAHPELATVILQMHHGSLYRECWKLAPLCTAPLPRGVQGYLSTVLQATVDDINHALPIIKNAP